MADGGATAGVGLVVLDAEGRIVHANEVWRTFAREHGADPRTTGVGASYLEVCRRSAEAGSPGAAEMVAVLEGFAREPDAPPRRWTYMLQGPDVVATFEVNVVGVVLERPLVLVYHVPLDRRGGDVAGAAGERLLAEALAETEAARRSAVELMLVRSRLLANVSHELRTPLHAILGFARIALGRAADDPRLVRILENIGSSAQRLTDLLDQVLDLSRLTSTRPDLTGSTTLLAACRKLVEGIEPLLLSRAIGVDLDVAAELEVAMPAPALQQVLHNLASNALKFSPQGGRISIRAVVDGGHTRLRVSDQGPGVPPALREVIFEEFAQANRTHPVTGVGLGLTISRALARQYGGALRVVEEPGWGATFELELPSAVVTR